MLKKKKRKKGKGRKKIGRKQTEEERKKRRKKGRTERGKEEGWEERKKMVNLGQYLWALTFQTRCCTDVKIYLMLDIMDLHFTFKEN